MFNLYKNYKYWFIQPLLFYFNRLHLCFIIFLISTGYSFSQKKDTIVLKEVNVVARRILNSTVGKKLEKMDTVDLLLFKNQNIAEILSFQTPVFIKNYGPGGISTTSFRGGNAAQTAILWNGLNIQNTMLGQVDLSTIPTSLFNQIEVEFGGSGSIWGSGAMGGSIHLNNKHELNKGLYTKLNFSSGNIGSNSLSTDIGYSDQKLSFKLKANSIESQNTYRFNLPDSNKIVTQKNAYYRTVSALPELKYFISPYQNLTVAAWFNKGTRKLPRAYNNNQFATQDDRSDRLNVNWNIDKKRIASNIKLAYLTDELNYTDSSAAIFSESKMKNMVVENDNYINWINDQILNIAANLTANKAITTNYDGTKDLTRASVTIGNKGFYLDHKLEVRTSLRAEQVSTGQQPITYNFALNYKINSFLEMKLNSGKVYRLPTLNDLYWNPGGNPNLIPEEGFTTDGILNFQTKVKQCDISISASVFNKRISNWILWLPGNNGNPTPENVKEVWSRGTETNWQLTYKNDNWFFQLKCLTSYVISTVTKTELENDNTLYKQLIYTPRYVINGITTVGFKGCLISYQHNYNGYRFTTSDNSSWIDPYHYSTLRFNYLINLTSIQLGTFANINNVLNSNYEVIENRPMPLRNFEVGIQINYIKKRKQKTI